MEQQCFGKLVFKTPPEITVNIHFYYILVSRTISTFFTVAFVSMLPICIMQCKLDVHIVGLCLLQGS